LGEAVQVKSGSGEGQRHGRYAASSRTPDPCVTAGPSQPSLLVLDCRNRSEAAEFL